MSKDEHERFLPEEDVELKQFDANGFGANDALPSEGLSFAFDGRIPLSHSTDDEPILSQPKQISIIHGIAIICGTQIGSGIFSSPGLILREVGSAAVLFIVWMLAAGLSWTGASVYAELGSSIPINGGPQAYLGVAFGPCIAYVYTFTSLLALKPGSQAITALISSEFICRVVASSLGDNPDVAAAQPSKIAMKAVALGLLVLGAAIQSLSDRLGTNSQVLLTMLKMAILAAIFIGAVVKVAVHGSEATTLSLVTSSNAGAYAIALMSALWAFDGFDAVSFVGGECKKGSVPTMINLAMACVTVLFLLVNLAFILTVPQDLASKSATIALDFGSSLAGTVGAILIGASVAVSAFGSLNSGLFTTGRLIVVASENGYIPRWLSLLNARGAPFNALVANALLTSVYVLVGDFASLTMLYGVCAWTWNLMTAVALISLRQSEPDLDRPFRASLVAVYIFCATCVFLIVLCLFTATISSLVAVGLIALGLIPYYCGLRWD